MVALLEEEGVFVVEAPFESDNLFGAFTYSEESGPCVLRNTHCTRGRQSTTAAHEYCHNLKDRERIARVPAGDVRFVLDNTAISNSRPSGGWTYSASVTGDGSFSRARCWRRRRGGCTSSP